MLPCSLNTQDYPENLAENKNSLSSMFLSETKFDAKNELMITSHLFEGKTRKLVSNKEAFLEISGCSTVANLKLKQLLNTVDDFEGFYHDTAD